MSGEPVDELVAPVATDPVPDLVEQILGGAQYISPSYWLGWVAEKVTGTNPWQWIADQYGGDWASVQRGGVALKHLGEFGVGYGTAVTGGMEGLAHSWTGVAADGAGTYFTGFGTAVTGQKTDLDAMGAQLITTATGMYETANAIKGLWETLLDLLIAMAAEAAAAAATSWTLVGPAIAAAAFALTLTKALKVRGQVLTAHTAAWNAVQGLTGLLAGYLSGLHDLDAHALPAGSYDHPGA